jgi:hypothetical protein
MADQTDPETGLLAGQKPLPWEFKQAFEQFAGQFATQLGNKVTMETEKVASEVKEKLEDFSKKFEDAKVPAPPTIVQAPGALNVAKLPLQQPEAFNGTGDVRLWLDKVERYMRLAGVNATNKGEFAVTFLRDQAYTVFVAEEKVLRANNEELTFERFTSCMLKHYATLMPARTARVDYDALKQTSSVADYVRETKRIAHELIGTPLAASNGEMVWRFVRGLKPEAKRFVEVNAPEGDGWTNFEALCDKAVTYELNNAAVFHPAQAHPGQYGAYGSQQGYNGGGGAHYGAYGNQQRYNGGGGDPYGGYGGGGYGSRGGGGYGPVRRGRGGGYGGGPYARAPMVLVA